MSNETATAGQVNNELPDEDALGAFAAGAFGSRRPRRKGKAPAADGGGPAAEPQPDRQADGAAEGAPVTSEPDVPAPAAEAEVQPEAAAPAVPVPAQERAAEPAETPAAAAEPEHKERRASDSPPKRRAEVEVQAYPVGPATPVPRGLRGGPIQVRIPDLGPAGVRPTQCTIMASNDVRDRFAQYQLAKKMAGQKEPSNALVVRRAFLHAKRQDLFGKLLTALYHQYTAVDDEDYDEDGMLGEVVGRRAVRGRLKDSGQQSFRPSEQELATYDAYVSAYGFPSRSDFLNAVLDEFLPAMPSGRRR